MDRRTVHAHMPVYICSMHTRTQAYVRTSTRLLVIYDQRVVKYNLPVVGGILESFSNLVLKSVESESI